MVVGRLRVVDSHERRVLFVGFRDDLKVDCCFRGERLFDELMLVKIYINNARITITSIQLLNYYKNE